MENENSNGSMRGKLRLIPGGKSPELVDRGEGLTNVGKTRGLSSDELVFARAKAEYDEKYAAGDPNCRIPSDELLSLALDDESEFGNGPSVFTEVSVRKEGLFSATYTITEVTTDLDRRVIAEDTVYGVLGIAEVRARRKADDIQRQMEREKEQIKVYNSLKKSSPVDIVGGSVSTEQLDNLVDLHEWVQRKNKSTDK